MIERAADQFTSGGTESRAEGRVGSKAIDRRGEGGVIAGADKQSRDVVDADFRRAVEVVGDDRLRGKQALHHGPRK